MTMADLSKGDMATLRPTAVPCDVGATSQFYGAHRIGLKHRLRIFHTIATLRFALRLVQGAGLIISTGGGAVLAYGVTLDATSLVGFTLSSGLMVLFGWLLFSKADMWFSPDICFDPTKQELRVSRGCGDGDNHVLLRRSFESLGGIRMVADRLQVLERDETLLVELHIPTRQSRAALRDHLSGHLPILS